MTFPYFKTDAYKTLVSTEASSRMAGQENLLYQLIEKSEKCLIPLGIWPDPDNTCIIIFNIIVLFSFSVLVLTKSILNPEGESIENAFTLANGGLCTGIYFVAMIVKKDKIIEFIKFIKTQDKIFTNCGAKALMIAAGKEYYIISIALLCILPAGTLIRFLQPPLAYGYVQFFQEGKNFTLPPAMGLPNFIFGDIRTYILESLIRMLILSNLSGICATFIVSTISVCTQLNMLGLELENISEDEKVIHKMIDRHQELLHFTKLLNEIFSPYFFADCFLSLINLSIMLFSLITHNVSFSNLIMEIPLVTAGMSQLFFILYYGDKLIDAVRLRNSGVEGHF
jgi:hypothetical protein